jgi:RHS repeat-associated protein
LFNAHGDVVGLADVTGAVVREYRYDAFGNEVNPDAGDGNPWRYCGEYFDGETGTYYLRARIYAPQVGRFTSEDTHWHPGNMIYGDNPRELSSYKDALGLSVYLYWPDVNAIRQSGNLYLYAGGNPMMWSDPNGQEWYHWAIIGGLVVITAIAVVATAGGALPAVYAVGAVASGYAASTTAATVAAGAFLGTSVAAGSVLIMSDIGSANAFYKSADWSTVGKVAGSGAWGAAYGYSIQPKSLIAPKNYYGNLSKAGQYGLKPYSLMTKTLKGTGLQAHHLVEQRFNLGINTSVAVTPAEHQFFTNAWRKQISYGSGKVATERIWEAAKEVYEDYPALLQAVKSALRL